ncbi:MAG: FtsW/RodA/SpoVE family cell cycle protein, partial [Actinomycetota bacterium]|nr:FtsW/RodA/SpoVE family cell cycle protein [Actinomycetota bacterium]
MTTFPAAGGRFREERDPWWFVVDPLLILSVMAITAMGALLVYSATRGPATELDPANTSFLTRQVFFAVVGAGLGLFAALINIERIRSLVSVAYISTLGLLLGTLLFGADINGTQAWYRLGGFTFQPSEPGKLVLIVTLATVFSGDRVGFQRMAAGLLLAGVPI